MTKHDVFMMLSDELRRICSKHNANYPRVNLSAWVEEGDDGKFIFRWDTDDTLAHSRESTRLTLRMMMSLVKEVNNE